MESEFRSRFVLLFELVENAGLVKSRADVAARLNYRPQAFNEILKGRTNVGLDLIQKFCIEFGASPEYLVLGSGLYFREKNQHLNPSGACSYTNLSTAIDAVGVEPAESECKQCVDKERIISALQKVITTQDSQVANLQEMVCILNDRKGD
ncbi:helix-turn-helix transcriptional regulator [Williamwhitmania taraxaci]|uniref:HTH cro/C1-type domain-containing protein n=1 Tax=Williamwhitmania taraxaci TaxID=1640674 RepID=A0A1G6QRN5_9BACT|nr:helix-turn-helix transcriptional regulator [Williamwhitmania taraxaci]SDC95010.1 hypothetical protein SAMN05216323_10657 [Williamwhitmania taraxaci]